MRYLLNYKLDLNKQLNFSNQLFKYVRPNADANSNQTIARYVQICSPCMAQAVTGSHGKARTGRDRLWQDATHTGDGRQERVMGCISIPA